MFIFGTCVCECDVQKYRLSIRTVKYALNPKATQFSILPRLNRMYCFNSLILPTVQCWSKVEMVGCGSLGDGMKMGAGLGKREGGGKVWEMKGRRERCQ